MLGLGFLTCNVQVGGESYRQQFIIYKQLTPGIILRQDFLSWNQLGITCGPKGVLQLRDSQEVSVQIVEEVNAFSARLTAKITIPPRSLVLISVTTTLQASDNKTCFDFTPLQTSSQMGPNCIFYPLDYATLRGGSQRVPQVLVNLGQQEVKLQKGALLGHFHKAQLDEIIITEEDIFGVNVEETLDHQRNRGRGFER